MSDSVWNGTAGDWNNAADWSAGVPNDPTANATISGDGSAVTISSGESFEVNTVTLGSGSDNASLEVDGTLSFTGVSDTLLLQSGTLAVDGGTISNATIVNDGGSVFFDKGTLVNVTYIGNLDIPSLSHLYASNLTVESADGSLPGTINVGDNVSLTYELPGTVDDIVINLGATLGLSAFFFGDTYGAGGALTLGSAATINVVGNQSSDYIDNTANGTIQNNGAINVNGAGSDLQIDDYGFFVNDGTIDVGAGASATEREAFFINDGVVNIASGASDTIQNLYSIANNFSNSGAINVDGGTLVLASSETLYDVNNISLTNGGLLDITGTLDLSGGTLSLAAGGTVLLDNGSTIADGTIQITGADVSVAAGATVDSSLIIAGGTLELASGATVSDNISFSGPGTLIFDGGNVPSTTIDGFLAGDTIQLSGVPYDPSDTVTVGTAGVVTISAGGTEYYLNISNAAVGETDFTLSSDLLLTTDVTCFYPGTRILTDQGEVAVEELTPGTMLITSSGIARPVRWLGRSSVSTRFADPLRVLPIRIKAGALGHGLPVRDLLVSPDHAMYFDGVLVQAGALVDGVDILRETNVPEIFTYFHVELATHELLLAEGAATESFVDNVDRMNFDNWAEHQALFGHLPGIEEMPYPRVKSARQLPSHLRRPRPIAA